MVKEERIVKNTQAAPATEVAITSINLHKSVVGPFEEEINNEYIMAI